MQTRQIRVRRELTGGWVPNRAKRPHPILPPGDRRNGPAARPKAPLAVENSVGELTANPHRLSAKLSVTGEEGVASPHPQLQAPRSYGRGAFCLSGGKIHHEGSKRRELPGLCTSVVHEKRRSRAAAPGVQCGMVVTRTAHGLPSAGITVGDPAAGSSRKSPGWKILSPHAVRPSTTVTSAKSPGPMDRPDSGRICFSTRKWAHSAITPDRA